MFSLPSTVCIGLEPEIGNQEVQIRDGTFSMLEALDGFDPSLQLAIKRLCHVVGPGQSMHTVMTHEPDPVAFEKADRFPLAYRLARAVSSQVGQQIQRLALATCAEDESAPFTQFEDRTSPPRRGPGLLPCFQKILGSFDQVEPLPQRKSLEVGPELPNTTAVLLLGGVIAQDLLHHAQRVFYAVLMRLFCIDMFDGQGQRRIQVAGDASARITQCQHFLQELHRLAHRALPHRAPVNNIARGVNCDIAPQTVAADRNMLLVDDQEAGPPWRELSAHLQSTLGAHGDEGNHLLKARRKVFLDKKLTGVQRLRFHITLQFTGRI